MTFPWEFHINRHLLSVGLTPVSYETNSEPNNTNNTKPDPNLLQFVTKFDMEGKFL